MSNGNGKQIKCPGCGFRMRGSNHEDGQHHKIGKINRQKYGNVKNAPVGRK